MTKDTVVAFRAPDGFSAIVTAPPDTAVAALSEMGMPYYRQPTVVSFTRVKILDLCAPSS